MTSKSLGELYNPHSNSFNDMRFLLASMVLFAHSYALLYGEDLNKADPVTRLLGGQIGLGTFSVLCFFVLSGFFMLQSLESSPSVFNYLLKRFYRIIPAYWTSLILSAFLLVPLIGNQVMVTEYKEGSSLYFFIHNALFQIFDDPWIIKGAFAHNPLVDFINCSSWTLHYELLLYLLLPVVIYITFGNRLLIGAVIIGIELLLISEYGNFHKFSFFDNYRLIITTSAAFFYGAGLYIYRNSILVSFNSILIGIVLYVIGFYYQHLFLMSFIVLPYLIIALGSLFRVKIFSKTGDYSYGMYIYAFPIQQTLIHFYPKELSPMCLFLTSFCITLILSIFSWHVLEKRFLELKKQSL